MTFQELKYCFFITKAYYVIFNTLFFLNKKAHKSLMYQVYDKT